MNSTLSPRSIPEKRLFHDSKQGDIDKQMTATQNLHKGMPVSNLSSLKKPKNERSEDGHRTPYFELKSQRSTKKLLISPQNQVISVNLYKKSPASPSGKRKSTVSTQGEAALMYNSPDKRRMHEINADLMRITPPPVVISGESNADRGVIAVDPDGRRHSMKKRIQEE